MESGTYKTNRVRFTQKAVSTCGLNGTAFRFLFKYLIM